MRLLPLHKLTELFHGAVSLEVKEEGIKPWRIPYADLELYPPNGIDGKAAICAGVRLRLLTNSTEVAVAFLPLEEAARMDLLVDGQLHLTAELQAGETQANFPALPQGMKELELYLPQNTGMTVTRLSIEDGALWQPLPDYRPRWVTYGSSITQCVDAHSPSRTWPAIAARDCGWNLTCLGFSGNAHLEPMTAKLIRDLPADLISLCVGINVYGASSLSPRTFKPQLIGMLQTIREKHPVTPLIVISPIYAAEREHNENKLGFTVSAMREEIRETVELLQRRGDRQLHYRNGLDWFSADDASHLPDGLHPNANGYELMGNRFRRSIVQDVM